MHVYYDERYNACEYSFDTTRKSAKVAKAIMDGRCPEAELIAPSDISVERCLAQIHDLGYIEAIQSGTPRSLSESSGFTWDDGIYTMAVAHSRGLVDATAHVLESGGQWAGSLSSGLHHASYSRGAGYCTFNGLAASVFAARRHGAERILVLDFDAHAGGGTMDIMNSQGDNWKGVVQCDVTVTPFDVWDDKRDTSDNRLVISDRFKYLDDINSALSYCDRDWDFVIYNAGMDPYDEGITYEMLAERERLVVEFMQGRQGIFALAGGYLSQPRWYNGVIVDQGLSWDGLVNLHLLTVEAWSKVSEMA
jgi:acetoin utilization deacetylase AcuC-like enzyme